MLISQLQQNTTYYFVEDFIDFPISCEVISIEITSHNTDSLTINMYKNIIDNHQQVVCTFKQLDTNSTFTKKYWSHYTNIDNIFDNKKECYEKLLEMKKKDIIHIMENLQELHEQYKNIEKMYYMDK